MAHHPKLAAIVPTHSDFPYSLRCLESLARHTQDYRAFVLDDASPEWSEDLVREIERIVPDARIHHFPENDGLTRSWNEGLRWARDVGAEYSALVNSDTLLSPGWFEGIEGALRRLDLVGPVSNAPGHRETYELQLVTTYLSDYELTDDLDAIARTADRLRDRNGAASARRVNSRGMKLRNRFRDHKLARRVNGFFLVARTATWWQNAYDAEHVFDPSKKLLGGEDEFQKRFTGRIGIALSTFIFHYRSASRGLDNVEASFSHGAYRPPQPLATEPRVAPMDRGSNAAGAPPFNPAYTGPRREVARLVPSHCSRILDVGCATGSLGAYIKRTSPQAQIVGVELDAGMAEVARKSLDRVLVGSIVDLLAEDALAGESFDCIVLADVLEHLEDPWRVLSQLAAHLTSDGLVIASLPNVRHYTTLLSLFFGKRWPYRDRGIHDRTHLRFFAQRNVEELFEGAGLKVDRLHRNYRILEYPHRINRRAWLLAVPPLRDLLTFQYYAVARRAAGVVPGPR